MSSENSSGSGSDTYEGVSGETSDYDEEGWSLSGAEDLGGCRCWACLQEELGMDGLDWMDALGLRQERRRGVQRFWGLRSRVQWESARGEDLREITAGLSELGTTSGIGEPFRSEIFGLHLSSESEWDHEAFSNGDGDVDDDEDASDSDRHSSMTEELESAHCPFCGIPLHEAFHSLATGEMVQTDNHNDGETSSGEDGDQDHGDSEESYDTCSCRLYPLDGEDEGDLDQNDEAENPWTPYFRQYLASEYDHSSTPFQSEGDDEEDTTDPNGGMGPEYLDFLAPMSLCPFYKTRDECIICQEQLRWIEHTRRLPCDHTFHASCIEEWVLRNATCPLCRVNLTVQLRELDVN
uniref:RING-type domain-containing protein n=1 Tax=Compsopogon caeruleus TaxID=31354 RepID=A0A7S1TFZ3_9RHOD